MTERTKGPWWTDTEGRGDQEHNVICASLGAHGTQVVVDDLNAGYLLDPDERYANAAYIVKACNAFPDLVKALEEIAELYSGGHGYRAKEIARDALAAVKGAPDHG